MSRSQTQWILDALHKGPLTTMEALHGCNCFRLAARINDLRNAGHDIETRNHTLPSGKTIGIYFLKRDKQSAISGGTP
jgi:hypothetical protein